MNIVFLTTEYYAKNLRSCGGLGVYVRKTTAALAERGHNVSVVWLSHRNARWYDGCVEIQEVCSSVFRLPLFFKKLSFFYSILTFIIDRLILRKIIKNKLRKGIQIIQAASYQSPAVFCSSKWPIITRLSSLEKLLIEAKGQRVTLREKLSIFSENLQINKSMALISPSKFLANHVSNICHNKIYIVKTIPEATISGTDEDFFNRYLRGKKYILYFGQLSRIKGTDIIIDILPDVFYKCKDVYVVFIGRDDGISGKMSCKTYALSKLSDYVDRIIFSTPLSHAELRPCIENAVCVLQPSRVDNFPNTCIEALSLKKPVIGTYPTSIEELIQNGINGFLVPKDNREALSKCVIDFLEGNINIVKPGLIEEKRDLVLELENIYKKYICVYDN